MPCNIYLAAYPDNATHNCALNSKLFKLKFYISDNINFLLNHLLENIFLFLKMNHPGEYMVSERFYFLCIMLKFTTIIKCQVQV